ncbi:hypothetical protein [Microvirgula aerodenitrificans]|uniref:hypothetical protein n=1 Tax=Microvirgula aerodenitrificans TaxID=57480 RepID=UPI002F41DFBD
MSAAAKYWAGAIASDAAVFGAFYLWQFESSKGASNVFAFLMWAVIAHRIFMIFVGNRTHFERLPRPNGFGTYHWVSEFAIICCMAWAGMFWCAGFYTFATLAIEGARNRELRDSKAGSA